MSDNRTAALANVRRDIAALKPKPPQPRVGTTLADQQARQRIINLTHPTERTRPTK